MVYEYQARLILTCDDCHTARRTFIRDSMNGCRADAREAGWRFFRRRDRKPRCSCPDCVKDRSKP